MKVVLSNLVGSGEAIDFSRSLLVVKKSEFHHQIVLLGFVNQVYYVGGNLLSRKHGHVGKRCAKTPIVHNDRHLL